MKSSKRHGSWVVAFLYVEAQGQKAVLAQEPDRASPKALGVDGLKGWWK